MDLEELTVTIDGTPIVISDALGLTSVSSGTPANDIPGAPLFIGFTTDQPIFGFGLNHTSDFFNVDVGGTNEDFWIDDLLIAPVPLPASMLILLTGLGGLAVLRRRQR